MILRLNKLTILLTALFTLCVTPFIFPQASLAACQDGQATLVSKTVTYEGTKPTFHFRFKTQVSDQKTNLTQDKINTRKLVVSDKYNKKLCPQLPSQKTINKKPVPAPQDDSKTVSKPAEQTSQPSTQVSNFQQQVVDLVNQERAKNGLSPLTIKQDLTDVAQMKAQDMYDKKYFDHTSPTYGSPFDMMSKNGISYLAAGENIALGQQTPEQVMQDWMNSPGHRANILNPNFTQIGIGVYNSYKGNGFIWVQEFCKR